ncbi:hypothetical protein [Streptomyces sp. NPDC093261]|uniref:hypothetical protein n=1 Tax=Streptomyces sp. NPDC093261 TaxID=3366037 RepID=UPI0038305942
MRELERRIKRLGDQLDAIALAVEGIENEDRPDQRARWLHAVKIAVDQAQQEQQALSEEERKRPHLRILPGGLASAFVGVAAIPRLARSHATAAAATAVSAAVVAAATGAGLYITTRPHDGTPEARPRPTASSTLLPTPPVTLAPMTPVLITPQPHNATQAHAAASASNTAPPGASATPSSYTVHLPPGHGGTPPGPAGPQDHGGGHGHAHRPPGGGTGHGGGHHKPGGGGTPSPPPPPPPTPSQGLCVNALVAGACLSLG